MAGVSRNTTLAPNTAISYTEYAAKVTKCKSEMHENRNPFLFLIEINNMHCTKHILPIPTTSIWRRSGRCGVSWHRMAVQTPLSCMVFFYLLTTMVIQEWPWQWLTRALQF